LGLYRIESEAITEEIFDTAVNMSKWTAARIVQKSINFLEIGNPLIEDGLIGPKTFERVYYWGRKDPEAFHKALNGFKFMQYVEIVENSTQENFARGWMKRIQYIAEDRNMDQEQSLEGTSLRKIILRGIKKLVTEMTSTKFLLLVFICIGIWKKFIQDSIGLGTALLIIGIREVPVDAIIGKLTGGLK
jgi:hypothetical protein